MPYIDKRRREELLITRRFPPKTSGGLNFVITDIINRFLVSEGLNYDNINLVIGVLECAKLELYRRVVAPHEDKKMEENGDVYFPWP